MTPRGAFGVPIGRRPVGGRAPLPSTPSQPAPVGASVPPRGCPFVVVDTPAGERPGVVVEQRREPDGWRVLVALVDVDEDGQRSAAVRWVPARRVRAVGG